MWTVLAKKQWSISDEGFGDGVQRLDDEECFFSKRWLDEWKQNPRSKRLESISMLLEKDELAEEDLFKTEDEAEEACKFLEDVQCGSVKLPTTALEEFPDCCQRMFIIYGAYEHGS